MNGMSNNATGKKFLQQSHADAVKNHGEQGHDGNLAHAPQLLLHQQNKQNAQKNALEHAEYHDSIILLKHGVLTY